MISFEMSEVKNDWRRKKPRCEWWNGGVNGGMNGRSRAHLEEEEAEVLLRRLVLPEEAHHEQLGEQHRVHHRQLLADRPRGEQTAHLRGVRGRGGEGRWAREAEGGGGAAWRGADLVDAVGPPDHDRLVVDHDERDVLHPERPPLPPPAARVRAARRREVAAARLVEDVERVLLLEGEEIMLYRLVARLW